MTKLAPPRRARNRATTLVVPAQLRRFVALCGGTDAEARRRLGIAKGTWSGYVNGHRKVPRYVQKSIDAQIALHQAAPAVWAALGAEP